MIMTQQNHFVDSQPASSDQRDREMEVPSPMDKHLDSMSECSQSKENGKHQVPLKAGVEAVVGIAGLPAAHSRCGRGWLMCTLA